MPLPLPPQRSRRETKKSQSSKIVPSDHGPSEKREENYQAKISPSSPQGPLKKRSAFEDLTNASQSQPAKPKKEGSNEFVKDVSKKINRNTRARGYNKLELSPVVVSTTMVPNIIDKPFILEISTSSKTPTTEEASLFKKPFILKEEPTTEDTILIKGSLKKSTNQREVSLLEKPLSLQDETDSDVVEPVTFGEKHKTEKAAINKSTLSLKNMCTHQGKQSCTREELALQDISVEEDSFFMEPINFRKKPKTEEATPTKKLLSLKKKCTTQGKMSCMKKPLVLQKITSEEKSLAKELLSFKRKPTTEKECLFQEPPALPKKHTTEQEVSILKKSLAFQEKINTEEDSVFKEPLAFKKQPTTVETTFTTRPLSLKKKCTTQGKIAHLKKPLVLQKTISGEKALIKESLSFKKKPTTKEESLFQELSVLQEKHTTDGEVTLLKKPEALQEKKDGEDEFLMEPISSRKKHTTKEATLSKKPLPLKKKHTTRGKRYRLKKPLVLQKTTSEEKSLIKKPLPLKKKPTTKESLFQEPSALQERHTTREELSILEKPLVLQKTPTAEESLLREPLAFNKKRTIEEANSSNKLLSLKKKCTSQGKMSCLTKPLVLQTISEEKSLIKEPLSFKKKPTTEEESLLKKPSALQEKHTIQGDVVLLKKLWALQENIDSKDEFLMDPVSFRKKHTTDVAISTKESLSLKKKKCTTQMMMPIFQEQLDLQNMIGEGEDSSFMEPMSFRKKSSTDETILTKTPVSLKKRQITQGKTFLLKKPLVIEKTTSEEESLFKELLPFKKKSTTEEFLFQDPSVLKERHTTLQEVSLSKKPLALQENITTEEESYIKEPLTLEERSTTEEEFPFQEPFSLHVKPTNKDESLFRKSFALQKKTDNKEDSLKALLALQDKSTTEEEFLFKKPLVLKEELSTEVAVSIEGQLSLKKKPTAQGEVFLLKKQLALQENITIEEESLIKQPQALQEKPSIEKETILRESLTLQENLTIEEETILKEPLALQENPSIEKEIILRESLALQEKPTSEKETLFEEPLALQENPTIEEEPILKEHLALQEKPSSEKDLSSKEPLALQKNLTHKEDTFIKDFIILQVETSPHVSTTAPDSRTGLSSTVTMSSVGKFSTTSQSSTCESSSNEPFSSQDKRSEKEMTPLEDIDKDHSDPFFNSIYAKDIFSYMKEREEKFILKKYMTRQNDINSDMRAILVDWLVEVQMTFEMSHETLYLAVKLVDHYLMEVICKRDKLQLLGSTAFLIAAKFEEPSPPCVDDFLYICDDIYKRDEMLAMEISILKTLKFDINIPIAYHFLRRYAKCVHASMKTLTLSRFICEMTLQEYDYVQERASKLAAGSFLLALYMKKLGHLAPTLEYYSGYKTSDLHPLVRQLNTLLTLRLCNRLKTVHSKYSHQVFFEVTKIPPLDVLKLEEILNCANSEAEGLVLWQQPPGPGRHVNKLYLFCP
ncbi:LOW QUALITY PROTEIN: G2/mitotic-specific cyclin-B3 [Sagmatias obliquidens]|uniref:LOW QUALITY PROTEIN: G2/mitotic-specific cyclin-B3 n=1 Tax=Sagmatias obliquidens TaxID=3371155 RepID=UPI000F44440B|nr:LOW QUALITY PROTEIN: G2/mitotic-specific cyclin-B3 [Lagenorhynchus obliquidens]